MTIGGGIGALGGAGIGYMSAPSPELRSRSALVGAGVGAGTGALLGGIAGETPESDFKGTAALYFEAGRHQGHQELAEQLQPGMTITPELHQQTLQDIGAQAAPINRLLQAVQQAREGVK